MPTIYRLKLTTGEPERMFFEDRDVFRVNIQVSDAENMPNEIFGHQKTLVDPDTSKQQDEFCFVCSPYELTVYPANSPNEGQSPAFFRKSVIDVLLPSVTVADKFITEVKAQVDQLISLMEKLDTLKTEVTWHGEPTTTTTTSTTTTTTAAP